MYDLDALRKSEFPLSQDTIFFNHAGISPLPVRSREKVKWALDGLSENPARFWVTHGMAYTERLRQGMAAWLNAASEWEIVPAATTGTGLNMVAQAIDWQPGDNILLCDLEFPANVYPWMSLERDGVEVRLVPAEAGGLTMAALEPLVDDRTRLVAASAIQFFSGHRTDLTAVGRFCHERNILFAVDAIQAIGHMPIDVQASHIDVLATGGQKSIMGLPGQGILYVRQAVAEQMHPRLVGGNAVQNFLHWLEYDLTPAPAAQRFLSGTGNLAGIVALVESLGLLAGLGIDNIDAHTRQLADHMQALFADMGYAVVTPRPSPGPIVTARLQMSAEAADELVAQLGKRNVMVVKHLDREGNPHLRTSFHCYNTVEEIDRFGEILREFNPDD